jgi:release factor glutamine methyltransferase
VLTVVEVLRRTQAFLQKKGSPSARLDAELLVAHALEMDRLEVYLKHDQPLAESELARIREPVKRRGEREPVATIIGSKEFYSLSFQVEPGLLVPRPDTECLVEAALAFEGDSLYVADVGAGTGCVGLSLAHTKEGWRIYCTDISPQAVRVVNKNILALGLRERVAALTGDLLDPIPPDRPIDLVVSNPPYIPSGEIDSLPPEISRHEPRSALDGGLDGLDTYRRLVPLAAARARLAVLVEVGAGQAPAVGAIFEEAGLQGVRFSQDLAGIDRVVIGEVSA